MREGPNDWAVRAENPKEQVRYEIENLREKLKLANFFYYILNTTEIMSHTEYDETMLKLKLLEKMNPEFSRHDSPSQMFGPESARSLLNNLKDNPILEQYKDRVDNLQFIDNATLAKAMSENKLNDMLFGENAVSPNSIKDGFIAILWHELQTYYDGLKYNLRKST